MIYSIGRVFGPSLALCLAALSSTGCSYESIRRSERMECQRIIDERERQRCLERWEDDQETYERKRREIEEDES